MALAPIDLAKAYVNTGLVHQSLKEGTRRYLTADFGISEAATPACNPIDLIERVEILYRTSRNPDKLTQARKIFIILQIIYPNAEVPAAVKAALGSVEKIRLQEEMQVKNHVAILKCLATKLFFTGFVKRVENFFSTVRASRYLNQHAIAQLNADGTTSFLLKTEVTSREILPLFDFSEGIAFLARVPLVVKTKVELCCFDARAISKEDVELFRKFVKLASFSSDHPISILGESFAALHVMEDPEITFEIPDKMAAFFTAAENRALFAETFPEFVTLSESLKNTSIMGIDKEALYQRYFGWYENCQQIATKKEDFILHYRKCYDELQEVLAPGTAVKVPAPLEFAIDALDVNPIDFGREPTALPGSVHACPKHRKKGKKKAAAAPPPAATLASKKEEEDGKGAPGVSMASSATRHPPLLVKPTAAAAAPAAPPPAKAAGRPPLALIPDPSSPFTNLEYDARVLMWRESPEDALQELGYGELPEHLQSIQVRKHAFTRNVDVFLGSQLGAGYIHRSEWHNPTTGRKDTLLSVVAEVERNGKKHRGVLTFCIDEEGICYHRYFGPRAHDEFVDMILSKHVRTESDFPSLQTSHGLHAAKTRTKVVRFGAEDTSEGVDVDPMGMVTIDDRENKQVIRLFKMRKIG